MSIQEEKRSRIGQSIKILKKRRCFSDRLAEFVCIERKTILRFPSNFSFSSEVFGVHTVWIPSGDLFYYYYYYLLAHYDGFHALVKGWMAKHWCNQESIFQERRLQKHLHSPFRAMLRPKHDSDLQRCLEIFIQPAITSHDGRPQAADLSTYHPFKPSGLLISPRQLAAGGESSPLALIGGTPCCVTKPQA